MKSSHNESDWRARTPSRRFSGKFMVRVPSEVHRNLAIQAAEAGVSLNRIAGSKNKMAAHMAGLGWIGKSCLLVTPEAGPRCRWATVLTDAPLAVTGQPMATRCGDCRECVDACPAQAFTGRNFRSAKSS